MRVVEQSNQPVLSNIMSNITIGYINTLLENLNTSMDIVRNDMTEKQQIELARMLEGARDFVNKHGSLV